MKSSLVWVNNSNDFRKAYDGEASQGVELKDYLNFYQVALSSFSLMAFSLFPRFCTPSMTLTQR